MTLDELNVFAERAGLPPNTEIKITGSDGPSAFAAQGATIPVKREMLQAVVGDRPTIYINTTDTLP